MNSQKTGPAAINGSKKARKTSAIILEVLSGMRTPTEAASDMGVAVNRYYLLETRALQGLVTALEPRPKGRQRKPEDEIETLKKEVEKLTKEASRNLALLRSTQRSLGVPPPPKQRRAVKGKDGQEKPRKHKPTVRAMKIVAHFKKDSDVPTDVSNAGDADKKETQ
jgi:hypothetical protein